MEDQESIFGHLLHPLVKQVLFLSLIVPALMLLKQEVVPQVLQLLWGMITSVIPAVKMESHGFFYGADPLWDGAGCGPTNTCCTFNNPPWFYKELLEPTMDDIEMRVCQSEGSSNEDIAIEMIDIYVQYISSVK